MNNDANATFTGNLTRDPELRYSASGTAMARSAIAMNRRIKQGDDWVDSDPTFLDFVCFRDLAEHVAQCLKKGQRVVIDGHIEQQNWEDKDTGEKKTRIAFVADDVAASLRFATAVIDKVEKIKPAASSGGDAGDWFGEEPF